jgi:chromosome segregation ATPase
MIAQAPLSESTFDGNRVRDSLSALRLGHDGLEQFVGLLFDEFDGLRDQLETDQASVEEERQDLRRAQAKIAAERQQWETDRQHWNDALQKRVVELEHDKLSLATELESERRRSAEVATAAVEQQRHFAEERAQWMAELRQLREHSPAEQRDTANEMPPAAQKEAQPSVDIDWATLFPPTNESRAAKEQPTERSAKSAAAKAPKAPAFNPFEADPVMGPLMSQFQLLQRDVARRRKKSA